MKKLFCLILLAATVSAHAAPKCIRYMDQELLAMTVDELKTTLKENQAIIEENSRMFASSAEKAARQSCLIQNQRVSDILKTKLPQEQTK